MSEQHVARLRARLACVEHLHALDLELARAEHARVAAKLVGAKAHSLGNAMQIARLASLQLETTRTPEQAELIEELVRATDHATQLLAELFAAAGEAGADDSAQVAPAVRAAVARVQPALAVSVELACDLSDDIAAFATAAQLEGLVLAALFDAHDCARVELRCRTRKIGGRPFVQIVRVDDREDAQMPRLVEALAELARGEASIGAGRDGSELAIELPEA